LKFLDELAEPLSLFEPAKQLEHLGVKHLSRGEWCWRRLHIEAERQKLCQLVLVPEDPPQSVAELLSLPSG
jgi:hypothetical protein